MKKLFAVTRSRASAWQASCGLEEQQEWTTHAAFMNELTKEGFVVLGGPLEDSPDVLLIVRAETEKQIIERLATDPWSQMGLLHVTRVARWNLRLGSLP